MYIIIILFTITSEAKNTTAAHSNSPADRNHGIESKKASELWRQKWRTSNEGYYSYVKFKFKSNCPFMRKRNLNSFNTFSEREESAV